MFSVVCTLAWVPEKAVEVIKLQKPSQPPTEDFPWSSPAESDVEKPIDEQLTKNKTRQ